MVTRYYRELLNFLSRSVKDRATAADLAQESFARIYAAQQAGQAIRDPRALLYRTARNLLTDHHRRGAVRALAGEVPDDGTLGDAEAWAAPSAFEPDAALSSGQGLAAMIATIDALPARCREAFVLYKFDGLSYAEVAERMGISVRTVEMQLQIAMKACWKCLDEINGHAGQPPRAPDVPRGKRGRA
ncbi:MAG: sigma-70 family RNA polymerase sigma factor [Pseudomonadota bacterium]